MVSLARGGFKGSGSFAGQGFRVEFDRSGADLGPTLQADGVAIRAASVDAVVRTTTEVKERIRDFIDAHFAGSARTSNNRRRVSNASAQAKFYDEIEEKGQVAGLIYSKFGKRDKGRFLDFLLLHVRGGTLRPGPGESWLRLEAEGSGRTAQANAQTGFFALSNSDIFFVPAAGGQKLFQLRRNRTTGKTQLLATLMKSITFPASLAGVEAVARSRAELFEGYFSESLARREFGAAS